MGDRGRRPHLFPGLLRATEPGRGPPISPPGQGLRTRIPEICSPAAWLLCPRTEGARCACPDTGGAVPAINSFCARDGSSPGAWPNSSRAGACSAPALHLSRTPLGSQTGDVPGRLVQSLPAKLETLKQREKLRHHLPKTLVTLHEDTPPPPSAPALLKHPVGGTLSSSCHSPKGHCCSFLLLLLGRVSLTVSMPAVQPPPPPPRSGCRVFCTHRPVQCSAPTPSPSECPLSRPSLHPCSSLECSLGQNRTEQSLLHLSLPVGHLHCWSAHPLNLLSPTLRGPQGRSLFIYIFIIIWVWTGAPGFTGTPDTSQ